METCWGAVVLNQNFYLIYCVVLKYNICVMRSGVYLCN